MTDLHCVQADIPSFKAVCCDVQDVLMDMAFDLGQVRAGRWASLQLIKRTLGAFVVLYSPCFLFFARGWRVSEWCTASTGGTVQPCLRGSGREVEADRCVIT
jgi:hypothetical protein